jgi:lipoyl(octanoyl) transferase
MGNHLLDSGILCSMENMCQVLWMGRMPYQAAWDLQNRLAAEIAAEKKPQTLLLLEHPHTFTFGRRGQSQNLIWDEAELTRRGVEVHWVDRGGDITYHGPGQLVGYPLLQLTPARAVSVIQGQVRMPQADYTGYLRRLEETLILTLQMYGVTARRLEGKTGVWIAAHQETELPAKIAAIGVKVDAHGVTRHGFALNVNTDPEYWQGLIGCGLVGYPVANLVDSLPSPPALVDVAQKVANVFGDVFGLRAEFG